MRSDALTLALSHGERENTLTANHLQQDFAVHRHQRMTNQRDQRYHRHAQRQRGQPEQARAREIVRQAIDTGFRAAP